MVQTELSVHSATQDVAEKSLSCPLFDKAHGGCPFDPQHPHSFNVDKFRECPAFKDGCPYKNTHIEKLKECPAFKDGKCPFDGAHSIDLSKVKECPAFQKGCPYTSIHAHGNMNEHVATGHIAEQASKCPFFNQSHGGCPYDPAHPHGFDVSKIKECPAFGAGCPFKSVHTEKLKECPAFKDGKCPFDGSHTIDLSKIKECPAFQAGCPYSSIHAQPSTTTAETPAQTTPVPAPTTTTTTTAETAPAQQTTAAPATEAARCPFSHLHGKVDNPHDK